MPASQSIKKVQNEALLTDADNSNQHKLEISLQGDENKEEYDDEQPKIQQELTLPFDNNEIELRNGNFSLVNGTTPTNGTDTDDLDKSNSFGFGFFGGGPWGGWGGWGGCCGGWGGPWGGWGGWGGPWGGPWGPWGGPWG